MSRTRPVLFTSLAIALGILTALVGVAVVVVARGSSLVGELRAEQPPATRPSPSATLGVYALGKPVPDR